MATKVKDLLNYFNRFDIILLVETFIEQKNENQMEKWLPQRYKWLWTAANRDLARGRPWGGAVIGVREGIDIKEHWDDNSLGCSGVNVTIGSTEYSFINLYNRKGIKTVKQRVIQELENHSTKKCIVMGDWNAKIGGLGTRTAADEIQNQNQRSTMDPTINEEGKLMMELMKETGLSILNGNVEGDWRGAITHTGYRSQAVIDYGAVNELAWDDIKEFKVGDCSLSDHFPLETTISTTAVVRKAEAKWIYKVSEGNRVKYKEDLMNASTPDDMNWEEIAQMMKTVAPRVSLGTDKKDPHWWNNKCYNARTEVQEKLREARKSNRYSDYRDARKRYKKIIKEAKEDFLKTQMEELKNVKDINGAWKYINKNQKTTQPARTPKKEDLVNYFKHLLGAKEPEITEYNAEQYLVTIEEKEFQETLMTLKSRKAAGVDEITAEMIKYADDRTLTTIRCLMEKCLQGQTIPETWRVARIHPLYKKGDPGDPQNYRGISIVNVIYKLYAQIICNRLTNFCETMQLLPDCQNGFRKRRSTIDSIYILNHVIQSTLAKGRQLYVAFIDFKAAFDTVNRKKLMSKMKKMGVPPYLLNAIADIYLDTQYCLEGEHFTTCKGLRQGCPLSPLLFALYTSDMETVLKKWQSGGVVVKKQKIVMLAYADDVAIMAETPEELKDMIKCLLRYANARDLIISTEKSKVMRFSRGGTRSRHKWPCGTDYLEEVRTFCYLGFHFQCTGTHSAHVKEVTSRAGRQLSRVWSLAERKFPDQFTIRKQMFHSLVEPIALYGCEVFGYRQYEEIERLQRKYLRWTLGLTPWTRNTALMFETRSRPLFYTTATRARNYEDRISRSPCVMVRECFRDMEEEERWRTDLAITREKHWNALGFSRGAIREWRQSGTRTNRMMTKRHLEQVIQQIACGSEHEQNVLELPGYLRKERDIKIVARFRLGCEERGSRSWGDRQCRVCHQEIETIGHILSCSGSQWSAPDLLHEGGKGIIEMKRIMQWREEHQ